MLGRQAIDLLREAGVASALSDASLGRLLAGSVVQILPAGTVLFEEGTVPDAAHVVLTGRAALVSAAKSGQETVIEIFGPGTFLLVPAVVLGLPYLASCRLMQESRVMTIRADVFRAELDGEPRFARAVVDMLAGHWRLLIEQIKDLKSLGATERLADWLLRESTQTGDVVALTETKRVLARRLGMSPESFSRAIAALSDQGAIAATGRTVRVNDRSRLASVAGRSSSITGV